MSSMNVGTIGQEAGQISGSGKMTAIEMESGNVYVEKISQVLMVSLSDDGREKSADRFIDVETRPYKSLYPYLPTDEALFMGRTAEIEIIQKRMEEQRVLVVHGQARIGKTSLLAAGVMPAMARGKKRERPPAFTLLIEDYEEPEKSIIEGLSVVADAASASKVAGSRLSFDAGRVLELPLLLKSIIEQSKKTLLLVLDQFERLFEPSLSEEKRRAFLNHLAEALRTIEKEKLRVIIAVRNESLEKLSELEKLTDVKGQFQNVLQCPLALGPLKLADARSAIEDPLHKVRPETKTIYDGDIVNEQLLPDLNELSPGEPGFIYPQQLQIVCTQLYLRAHRKKGDTLIIDSDLYADELEGAESIMASFMRDTLKTTMTESQQGLAVRLLAVLSVPGAQRWMKPAEFYLKDTDEREIEQLLELLVEAKFLIRSSDAGEKKYALVSQMVTTELRRLSGTGKEVDERYNAEDELERIWYTWLALEHLASREQIRYLAKSGGHLKPRAAKTLLLLRSAVEQDEQAETWVERLRGDLEENERTKDGEGKELIEQLEIPDKTPEGQRIGSAMLAQARKLLGFSTEKKAETQEAEATPSPPRPTQPALFGPIAEKAVSAPLSNIRQTCALALAAADPDLALKHLDAALKTVRGRWRRLRRKSELRGALADADPQMAQLNSELPLLPRLFIWDWRTRRRISRDSRRLAWLTLGGAIGAGLGIGLLRALLAITPGATQEQVVELPGQEFGIYFFFAGTLGAALSCGLVLSTLLQLTPATEIDNQIPPSNPTLRTSLLRITFGTALFGMAHAVIAWLNGISLDSEGWYYVVLMGFAVGLGLSVALSFPIRAGKLSTPLNWIFRLFISTLTFVLVDQFFQMVSDPNDDNVLYTQITRSRSSGAIKLVDNPYIVKPLWLNLSSDPQTLATIHAILTGIFMITGLSLGLRQANKALTKRRSKADRL